MKFCFNDLLSSKMKPDRLLSCFPLCCSVATLGRWLCPVCSFVPNKCQALFTSRAASDNLSPLAIDQSPVCVKQRVASNWK